MIEPKVKSCVEHKCAALKNYALAKVFKDDADLYEEGSAERLEAKLMKVENLLSIE